MKTDVAIIGKGISGILLSFLLKQKGISSVVLDKGTKNSTPLAETLPPTTLPLLAQLNLLDLFEKNASKTYGYQSKWNDEKITDQSFFSYRSFKYGFKLNKQVLLQQLATSITENILPYNAIDDINFNNNLVSIYTKKVTIESNLIVDATGRNRGLLKFLDIPSIDYDHTFAFICYVPRNNSHLKYGFFTESFDDGWGTVSDLNETTRIITLYTSKSNFQFSLFKSFENWRQLLANTLVLKAHLPTQGNFKIIGKKANSSKPLHITGKNWLAVGDAAIAFDPISSHGISNAIFCCNKASIVIEKFMQTKNSHILKSEYEDTLVTVFNEYLLQKEKLYPVTTRASV
ncbi:NAD(P)/FAD-dependent oxidoreductase [Tenacibaculum sp. M341]|uniref:NAD(P)/FAD-dependent oxidoreductase n=1 Tax=Tenacibaculum sp. M341 TaxID=2530339 RepID=UPI00104FFCF4|nr:FAD-dependent monooxygenase [Tenacibaculum sp. M341]TCI93811.1 hypothetical protein EYW44_05180 [Tenacibaculum sp. M341]